MDYAASHGEFLAAGGLLVVRGHLPQCPGVSPNSCNGSNWICTSDTACALICAGRIGQGREFGYGVCYHCQIHAFLEWNIHSQLHCHTVPPSSIPELDVFAQVGFPMAAAASENVLANLLACLGLLGIDKVVPGGMYASLDILCLFAAKSGTSMHKQR